MIVSASYRTDIPAFYTDWFLARLAAGFCEVRNPYNSRRSRVSLAREDVDGFIFWTKNLAPFFPALAEVARRGYPFVVQYSINGYPRALEHRAPPAATAVEHLRKVAERYGPRAAVWRYDAIVFTSLTPVQFHRESFARLAASLAGAADEVVVSCANIYQKAKRNLNLASTRHSFTWEDPPIEVKTSLLRDLADCARAHGMRLTVCGQPEMGLAEASCVDPARLSDVAGYPITARRKPHRPCGCYQSVDIGAYDTCPMGCVYCYAVSSEAAAERYLRSFQAGSETVVL
jgi:hypothetical protein